EGPDVVLLNEVGGLDSLRSFARLFLGGDYVPLLLPGRARRGIGNGFLVRRGLPLRAEIRSHRNISAPFRSLHDEHPARGPAAELRPLYERTDLEDVLEVAGRPSYERITHLTFFLDEISSRQLDYIFIPAPLRGRLLREETYVHRYRFAEDASALELPLSLRE